MSTELSASRRRVKFRLIEDTSQEKSQPIGGYPETVEYINSVFGEISKYGGKEMPDGRVWVIHGRTGLPVERHKVVAWRADEKGNVIYLSVGEDLKAHEIAKPSVWANPAHI